MKTGPKYKIARRLGAQVFEKTQGPKFALNEEKRKATMGRRQGGRSRTNFAIQLLEKQRARFTYGLSEKQFSKYVKEVIQKKEKNPTQALFVKLETRLDNAVLRSGFARTRALARQIVSHGHILVNGKKVTIASYVVKKEDVLSIRERSKDSALFADIDAYVKEITIPAWISFDSKTKSSTIQGFPTYAPTESHFDLSLVIQFYKR